MNYNHTLKTCFVSAFRTFIITSIFFLAFDIITLKQDNFINFMMIIIIVFICSSSLAISNFMHTLSKEHKSLKHISLLVLFIAFILILFLQLPFVKFIVIKDEIPKEIKISIGKITTITTIDSPKKINENNIKKNDPQNKPSITTDKNSLINNNGSVSISIG